MVNSLKCTENQNKAAISDCLARMGIHHWRQNSGGRKAEYKGKIRWFWFMQWLWPKRDLLFLDLGGFRHDGIYFEVEVKATGKIPTNAQYETINYINKQTNAVALWADSIDMFIEKWKTLK